MRILRTTTTVARGPQAVFDVLIDPTRAPRWVALLDRMEQVDEGPLHEGSRWRLTIHVAGREVVQHTTVHVLQPPTAYVLRTLEQGYDARFGYRLTPDGAGTRIDFELDLRPRSLSALLVFPFAARGARARLRDRLERLRAVVEAPSAR